MTSQASTTHSQKTKRQVFLRRILFLVLGLVVLALVHPLILEKALRIGLANAAEEAGLRLEIGKIQANLARPLSLETVQLRAKDDSASRTAATIERVEIVLNWPWSIFLDDSRLIKSTTVDKLRGVFDLRSSLSPKKKQPRISEAQMAENARKLLGWLPEAATFTQANVEILGRGQSYYLDSVNMTFSEEQLGAFEAAGAEIQLWTAHDNLGSLKGTTAWKDGTLYLANLPLKDGLAVENLQLQLARPGGPGLELEAQVFGGALRGDVSFGVADQASIIDAALWFSGVDIAPVSALLGLHERAEGKVKEARLTFRGNLDQPLDGQASLRLSVEDFDWKNRSLESLNLGANLIHRRLAVSDFSLRQKGNSLSGNGELLIAKNWPGISKAPYVLNASASIADLGALSGLFGSPFDEMRGRMTLSTSINSQSGKLGGYLSMEASDMGFRKHPIDSGRVEINFVNNEAQVSQLEFWSGEDYVRGKGTFEIPEPHNYSGEVQARLADIASYLSLLKASGIPTVYAGSTQIRWQGDGTFTSHSGAFNIALTNFISEQTPSGITGRFGGSYSPQNIYFSGLELDQGPLRFSTRATLAESGIKLQQVSLRSGSRAIADGELFLPLNPFALLARKPWKDVAIPNKQVYADLKTHTPIGLRDLLKLTGNDRPAEGAVKLSLKASGPLSDLVAEGTLEGTNLTGKFDKTAIPVSQLHATVQAGQGEAMVSGTLTSKGLPSSTLKIQMPIALRPAQDGDLRWMDPQGALAGHLDIPNGELSVLRPFFPHLQQLAGSVSGNLTIGGTLDAPLLNGQVTFSGGLLGLTAYTPPIENISGSVKFDGAQILIEKLSGTVAKGPLEFSGTATLGTGAKYDFTLSGRNILLSQDPGLRFRANTDLKATGSGNEGIVSGSLKFVESQFLKRLEITPVLAPSSFEKPLTIRPRFEDRIPQPFNRWKLDIGISNENPFAEVGNITSGEINPDLRLAGTLGDPIPSGRISLKGVRVFLPSTTLTIQEGQIDFLEDSPWIPQLNIRGIAQALDYEVQAFAFGPLNERRLILRSDPPLSQESLILLLTSGIAPGVYASPNITGTAAGPSSELLLRAFARQLNPQGVDTEAVLNRIQASGSSTPVPGSRSTLRGRFDLWRGLSLMNERDNAGFANPGVTYTLKLQ